MRYICVDYKTLWQQEKQKAENDAQNVKMFIFVDVSFLILAGKHGKGYYESHLYILSMGIMKNCDYLTQSRGVV